MQDLAHFDRSVYTFRLRNEHGAGTLWVRTGDTMPRRRHTADPARVIGYVRVSTTDQALGPEAQRGALARWCEARGAVLVAVYEDLGVSGAAKLESRPGLLAAVSALAEHGAGVLLVGKRDRLARDVMTATLVEAAVARHGARVLSAAGEGEGDDPAALLMRRMMDAFAEHERARIAERTRAALKVKRDRGERLGGDLPIGRTVATDGRTLVADPAEARAVEIIRELRAAGWSVRRIAEELDARGVPARGDHWHPTTVVRIAKRVAA